MVEPGRTGLNYRRLRDFSSVLLASESLANRPENPLATRGTGVRRIKGHEGAPPGEGGPPPALAPERRFQAAVEPVVDGDEVADRVPRPRVVVVAQPHVPRGGRQVAFPDRVGQRRGLHADDAQG